MVATAQASGEGGVVDVFYAPVSELDPDPGSAGFPARLWRWTAVKAVPTAAGRFEARWPLTVMRPIDPGERLYRWGDADALDPDAPAPSRVLTSCKGSCAPTHV